MQSSLHTYSVCNNHLSLLTLDCGCLACAPLCVTVWLVYTMKSIIGVDAAKYPNTLKYLIGPANDWAPKGFNDLPTQLQPYLTSDVFGDHAPTSGIWRAGQVVYARLNSTSAASGLIGWRCVGGGKPGTWRNWSV